MSSIKLELDLYTLSVTIVQLQIFVPCGRTLPFHIGSLKPEFNESY